jgi:hypothetical protein
MDEYPEYVRSMVDQYIAYSDQPRNSAEMRGEIEDDLATIEREVNTRSASYQVRLKARFVLRRAGITRHPSRPPLDVQMYLPRTTPKKDRT